jgi:hypothetical protein
LLVATTLFFNGFVSKFQISSYRGFLTAIKIKTGEKCM